MLTDTSVLIKWFRTDNETEVAPARALRDAHIAGTVRLQMIDLAMYELGNVLVKALRLSAEDVLTILDGTDSIVGPPVGLSSTWLPEAARLATEHGLSFYDACWAAAARQLDVPLVSADRQLLAAGLAESATTAARRLDLLP